MQFLLDTDTCVYALKQREPILRRLLALDRSAVAVSVITEAELRAGAAKSTSAARTMKLLDAFLRPIRILEFNSEDAKSYATVREKLERRGRPIGPMDTLLAAHALSRNLILVTNNQREFGRVPGLTLANWTE